MTGSNNSDIRRDPRIEVNAYVDYTGKEVLLFHHIENISLGGISIKSPTIEAVGTIVELVINFPEFDDSVELTGEVVWARAEDEGRMGIKFIDVDPELKARLKVYLAKVDTFYSG